MAEKLETVGHDTPTDAAYRVFARVSFAVLLLGVGVPLWWHTTAVPRVSLPYSGIANLSKLQIKLRTKVHVAGLGENRVKLIAEEITRFFQNAELYDVHVSHEVVSHSLVSSAYTAHELEKVAQAFDLRVGDVLLLEAPNLTDGVLVGSKRTIFFSTETSGAKLNRVLSEWILSDASLALTRNALAEPTKYSLDSKNRRRFPASPAYDVLLTLVNPSPEKLSVEWNLPTVMEEYIAPFLNELLIVSNASLKSQWLYLLPLEITPKQVPDSSLLGRHYALPEDVLPQVITPLEKKLASQVSLNPCINLVVYTPPCDKAPLHIYTRSGQRSKPMSSVQAFLSPRWGGVVIANPPIDACKAAQDDERIITVPEASSIMGVFISQLRLLLGIPDLEPINGVTTVPLDGSKTRDWEMDFLLRIRAVEQLTSAKLTLQSLAQLLEEISNIVITETVGDRIKGALRLVEHSAVLLNRGELREGFALSREAFVMAEAAFTDPSLLALLYFPDDQKYAVYIPLFLPVMIPVMMSLKNIRQYFFPKKKEEKTGDANEKKAASDEVTEDAEKPKTE